MAPFHPLINLNWRGTWPPNRQIILSKCALFITFNFTLPEGLQIIVLECHCRNRKKEIGLEFHTARPFALHKTSFCLRNCCLLPSNSWLMFFLPPNSWLMMAGYKIPATVGPQSFDKWVLSDLIECKNASTCEIGLSGRPGGLSGLSDPSEFRSTSTIRQIHQRHSCQFRRGPAIPGVCQTFQIGGSKLLEVCL